MPSPQVLYPPAAAQAVQRGIDVVADALGPTLGPLPSPIVERAHAGQAPEALADAPTMARRIVELEDRQADVGAMLLRNWVWQAERQLGDGGATVAVLAQAMLREAARMAAAGVSRSLLAQGLRWAGDLASRDVESQSRPVQDETDLAQVALTVTGDREGAARIGEVRYVMGPEAIVNVEEYVGRRLDTTYVSPAVLPSALAHGVPDPAQATRVSLPDCLIAAVDAPLDDSDDMLALLEASLQARKSHLVILARAFGETVLAWLALNRRQPGAPLTVFGATYAPTASAADVPYHDLACLTGCTVLGLPHTKPVSRAGPGDFGRAARVDLEPQRTIIAPEARRLPAVKAQARRLRRTLEQLDESDPSRAWLRRRIGMLELGTGEVQVGADTDVERGWRKRIIERGLRSVRHAQQGGVVPGGGSSLVQAKRRLGQRNHVSPEVRMGLECVARALAAPMQRLLANAHHPAPAAVINRIEDAGDGMAYDVLQGRVVPAFAAGLLDPAPVISGAVRIAASGAATALTIDSIVLRRNPPRMATP